MNAVVKMTQAEKEEISHELMELIRLEPDQGRRTVLMMILRQNDEFTKAVQMFTSHVEESVVRSEKIDALGSLEDIKKRSLVLDKMVLREEKRIKTYEMISEKFVEGFASSLGRRAPKLLIALAFLLWVGWEEVLGVLVKFK
jgi:hypothetical protein